MEILNLIKKKCLKISIFTMCLCIFMFLVGYLETFKFVSFHSDLKMINKQSSDIFPNKTNDQKNRLKSIKTASKTDTGRQTKRLKPIKAASKTDTGRQTKWLKSIMTASKIDSDRTEPSITGSTLGTGRLIKRIKSIKPTSSGIFDFEKMKPLNFSTAYKNPCWIGTENKGLTNDERLHCIPYFYILGVMKCGTSDLYQRLLRHPEFVYPGFKEAQWFAHGRLYGGNSKRNGKSRLQYFIRLWDKAANIIQSNPSVLPNGTIYHTYVIADASPSNIYLNTKWKLVPGNEGLYEPNITNLHCIKRLYPAAKVIITFRNPVDRLYSDYYFRFRSGGIPSRDEFHDQVVRAISDFKECVKTYAMRKCVYDDSVWEKTTKFRLDLGFYEFYMKEVLSVFDESNILTLLLSHYQNNLRTELQRVMDFLGFSKPSDALMADMTSLEVQNNKGYLRKKSGEMRHDTRTLLEYFYKPFNKKMAELMHDERYLFLHE